MSKKRIEKIVWAIALGLFIVGIAGFSWLASMKHRGAIDHTFGVMSLLSFTSGMSMIVLPCTLPLLFIIIPLAMGREYKRGLGMAVLFGVGLGFTITAYGIAMALLGRVVGIKAAEPWLIITAGVVAYLFALSEFSVFTISLPFFKKIMPRFLEGQDDYVKSFGLGVLLGNVGVGCPNPLFYVLLFYIAGTANVAQGALLGFIHGLGRAVPVILLTIISLFGVRITDTLLSYRVHIKYFSAWLLAVIAAVLISSGLFNVRGWWFVRAPWRAPYAFGMIMVLLALLPILKWVKKQYD